MNCWGCGWPVAGGVCTRPHPRYSHAQAVADGHVERPPVPGGRPRGPRRVACPLCEELLVPERGEVEAHERRHIEEVLRHLRALEVVALAEGMRGWRRLPTERVRDVVREFAQAGRG